MNKDNENEGIGILTIIVVIILAVVGLYYFFSHRPAADNTNVPLEAPAPIHDEQKIDKLNK